jgi:hypothetical protein
MSRFGTQTHKKREREKMAHFRPRQTLAKYLCLPQLTALSH